MKNLVTPFALSRIFFLKLISIGSLPLIEQVTKQFNLPLCLFIFIIGLTIAFSYVYTHLLCLKY